MHTDVQSIKMSRLQMDGKQTQAESAPSQPSIHQTGTDRALSRRGNGISALMPLCECRIQQEGATSLCRERLCFMRACCSYKFLPNKGEVISWV